MVISRPILEGGSNSPQWARATSFTRFLDHTRRHTTVGRTPLDEWSARRRDLYLTTQYSQETEIHAPCGIWTHNQSKRAAADSRFRPRGDWDHPRPFKYIKPKITFANMILWSLFEISVVGVMRYLSIRVFKNKICVAFSIKIVGVAAYCLYRQRYLLVRCVMACETYLLCWHGTYCLYSVSLFRRWFCFRCVRACCHLNLTS